METTDMTRRDFVRRTAALVAAPVFIPASALGLDPDRAAPSERITMGCIGVGGQGGGNMGVFLGMPDVQVVAVCDVDAGRRDSARQRVEGHYAAQKEKGEYSGCMATRDFREVLARDDIDTVMIGTPDHWHALITIAAVRAGKDVYCEKPLTYSIREGQAIVEAVNAHGRVLQTGTQRRSMSTFRYMCELVRNGYIGNLETCRVGLPGKFYITGGHTGLENPSDPPDGFDYDMWLGPAPWAPYSPGRCHFNFRWILDYGEGYISDWGAHYLDVAHWAQGADRTGPVHVEATAHFPQEGIYDAPDDFHIEMLYADGVRSICSTHEQIGMRFEGDEGWVQAEMQGSPQPIEASDPRILETVIKPDDIHLPPSDGHHANFIQCVKSRAETVAPAEIGHRSAAVCHIATTAARLCRPLDWDPESERFTNSEEANRFLHRPMRSPWRLD